MVDNPFGEMGGALFGKIFSGIIWFGLAVIVIGVIFGVMWYFIIYRRKFDIKVKVISDRAGDPAIYFDSAAILYDKKDKNKYFRFWGERTDLPVPPFKVLQKLRRGDYLEVWRKSEDEFVFLTPPRINKMKVLRADGKLYPIAQTEQKQVEGDIAYWNIKRKEKNKRLFDTESILMKLLPYIPHIIGGVITIFVLYILMDSLPEVLRALTDLAQELRSLKGAEVIG